MSHPAPTPSDEHAHEQHPPMVVSDAVLRRRSADVGGLHLALRGESQGQGWLDSTSSDTIIETRYAELLTSMYRETLRLVENNVASNDPPELSHNDRVELLKSLESWRFEPLRMPEDRVLACVLFLFQVLFRIEGMKDAIKVDMNVIRQFILHIRQLYRWQNHYHNFEHAVDVLQAIHCYLREADVVPSVSLLLIDADAPGGKGMWTSSREPDSGPMATCLTPHEIFALYLAAIGHDVAHPGFNNPFMENAEAPLSQVYDNRSALEHMHSYLLLTTMRHHGLGVLLDDPQTGTLFRKILKGSVLATDMGVHQKFMDNFKEILDGTTEASNGFVQWQSTKCERQAFICQLLLKNADISNPCRPFSVSKQWASALQQEWACQYKFENFLSLTHSVNPSNEPLAEAKSQVFFTRNIAKPLVDMTTIAIPELRQYSHHCAENLEQWERILKELKDAGEGSTPEAIASVPPFISTPTSTNPSSASSSHPSSTSVSNSPTRQNSTTTPNYVTSPHPSTFPQSQSQGSIPSAATLISISASSSISSTITTTTTTTTSSASSSNPVSPRILNPSENDYSTAFRLTLPRTSSTATTAKSDGGSSMASMSPAGTPGSVFGSSMGRQVSRTPSSSGGGGGGLISPSLSRAAARVIATTSSRTSSSASGHIGSSEAPSSPPVTLETRRYPLYALMYPHPIAYTQPQPQLQPTQESDRTNLDGYKFPFGSGYGQGHVPPPPPPTAETNTFYPQSQPHSHPQSQSHSSTPSISLSLSRSDSPSQINLEDEVERELVLGFGGMEDDVYEMDNEAHRERLRSVVGRGVGVGGLKKKKSGNILGGGGGGGSGNHGGGSGSSVFGVNSSISPSGGGQQRQQHHNRASWCSGEPVPIDVDREVKTVEDAKGTIESWRGRRGSASFGVVSGESGKSRAVAAEESESEIGDGEEKICDGGSIPAGLVSAAPINNSTAAATAVIDKEEGGVDPRTPPQQTGTLIRDENRSGSPTPKAKSKGMTKMKETDAQRKRREEEEEKRAEAKREKLREELIRDFEKEKGFLSKEVHNSAVGGGGVGSSGGGRRSARSRSRSKARRKGKGKK